MRRLIVLLAVALAALALAGVANARTENPVAALTVYHSYISPSGNDAGMCTSLAPCQSFARGCAVVNAMLSTGDTGYVEAAGGSDYGSQQIFRGDCAPSGSGTFVVIRANNGGSNVTVAGDVQLGGNNGALSGTAPNQINFEHINIAQGHFVQWYNCPLNFSDCGSSDNTANAPAFNSFSNGHIWCTSGCSGSLVSFNGSRSGGLFNTEVGPACCDEDMITLGVTPGRASVYNWTGDGNYIHDAYDACANMPSSVSNVYGCSGSNAGQHVDGIQAFGCDTCTVENSRFYAGNPASSSSQGNNLGQAIFFQSANGGTFSNLTFQNNMLECWCGTNEFSIAGPGNGTVSGYVHIWQNTVPGQPILIYDQVVGGVDSRVLAPGTSVSIAGNIFSGVTHQDGTSGCSFTAADGSTINPQYITNLRSSGSCGSGGDADVTGTESYVSTNFYTPNLHLSGTSGPAYLASHNYQGAQGCTPAFDIDNQSRPVTTSPNPPAPCTIGADEP